jgi:very-short-patch-repair endonuclease
MLLRNWARLYSNPTPAELVIEREICLLGMRYRAQHPIWQIGAIVDFALLDEMVIIEVDGASHLSPEAKEKDRLRTQKLNALGWQVVRVTNQQVFSNAREALFNALAEPSLWATPEPLLSPSLVGATRSKPGSKPPRVKAPPSGRTSGRRSGAGKSRNPSDPVAGR